MVKHKYKINTDVTNEINNIKFSISICQIYKKNANREETTGNGSLSLVIQYYSKTITVPL